MKKLAAVLCTVLVVLATSSPVSAELGDLLASYRGLNVYAFALDAERGLLYASARNRGSVVVIDTATLVRLDEVVVGPDPRGLALSPDGSRLYVALGGASSISVVDTDTLTVVDQYLIPKTACDVEAGLDGRLYATPGAGGDYYGIMVIDTNTGQYLGDFDIGEFVHSNSMLEISPDRCTLYFADRAVTPATLAKFDVSGPTPVLLYRNPHGYLGSSGRDLVLSHAGDSIYYVCAAGNGPGYDIAKINTADLLIGGWLDCGAYPSQLALGPRDSVAYVVHTSGHIDLFDTTTCLWTNQINTGSDKARELIIDRSGMYLFAAFDNVVRVYDTGAVIPVDIDIKPGADPNYISRRSNGFVSVAVTTTPEFDASTVDPATVEMAGAPIGDRGGEPAVRLRDVDEDGDMDFLASFRVRELALEPDTTSLTLTGKTYSGESIEGSDQVILTGRAAR